MVEVVFPSVGAALMAIVIMISAFGCMNGLLLAGARAYFAMARDGLFFRRAGVVNRARVPGASLGMQGAWAAFLVLVRTYDPSTRTFGNLYSNLLDYVVSADLLFYILTIAAVFRLRSLRPEAERPYRTWGYPLVPALYILSAALILAMLFVYRPATTFPGLVIVLTGVPVYFAFRRSSASVSAPSIRRDS
jgi:APA family basic amino acid/polyamine antiporter